MKILHVDVHLMDNGDYLDCDVTMTMDDKYQSQYRWLPYKEVETGKFGVGSFEFAGTRVSEWEQMDLAPPQIIEAFTPFTRKVAEQLGVPNIRVASAMTNLYDRATLGVAGSKVLDPL